MPTDPRMRAAVQFAGLTNRGVVQPWMRWVGWRLHVGCDRCAEDGADAACWGLPECHEYDTGCGCLTCAERQEREEHSLGSELAAVSRQLGAGS
ncbi:MAG: hypothetical protein M3376_07990 [Actinomycetota bacterium]|nr:hypothetical protein [Actinomycetota bacterium]